MKNRTINKKYHLLDDTTLIRRCDKSFIEHAGLTVPKNLYDFFGINDMELGSTKNIILEYQNKQYNAHFVREKIELARIRLFWERTLKKEFTTFTIGCVSLPSVKFEKQTTEYYRVEFVDYLLLEDFISEIEVENKQNNEVSLHIIKSYSKEEMQDLTQKRKQVSPKLQKSSKRRYETDVRLKATRNELSNYRCEVDHRHITFSRMSDSNDYVECHHLIPMMAQDECLPVYLDSLFNLVSLCPMCHAQIHYGNREAIEDVFWKCYELRKTELEVAGFTKEKMHYILEKYYIRQDSV